MISNTLIKTTALATLLLSSLSWAGSYTAKYHASYKGMSGDANYTVNEENGTYRATLSIIPNNLLVKMAVGSLSDNVSGSFADGRFYPSYYQREKNGQTDLSVTFGNQQVTVSEDGEKKQFSISPFGQDPLSQMAQVQYDMQHGQLQSEYHLVTNSSQRTYSVSRQGNRVILTEKPSKYRQLILEFDNNASTLLKMQKHKGGKLKFFMEKI